MKITLLPPQMALIYPPLDQGGSSPYLFWLKQLFQPKLLFRPKQTLSAEKLVSAESPKEEKAKRPKPKHISSETEPKQYSVDHYQICTFTLKLCSLEFLE